VRPAVPSRVAECIWLASAAITAIAIVAFALHRQSVFGGLAWLGPTSIGILSVAVYLGIYSLVRRRRLLAEARADHYTRMMDDVLGASA
jgi:hypothetical protein